LDAKLNQVEDQTTALSPVEVQSEAGLPHESLLSGAHHVAILQARKWLQWDGMEPYL